MRRSEKCTTIVWWSAESKSRRKCSTLESLCYAALQCWVIRLVRYISGSKLLPFQLLQIIHKPHIWWCSNYSYALHPSWEISWKHFSCSCEREWKKAIPPPTTIPSSKHASHSHAIHKPLCRNFFFEDCKIAWEFFPFNSLQHIERKSVEIEVRKIIHEWLER